jgi:hypothetical protein
VIRFTAVVWKVTRRISEVCLYRLIKDLKDKQRMDKAYRISSPIRPQRVLGQASKPCLHSRTVTTARTNTTFQDKIRVHACRQVTFFDTHNHPSLHNCSQVVFLPPLITARVENGMETSQHKVKHRWCRHCPGLQCPRLPDWAVCLLKKVEVAVEVA